MRRAFLAICLANAVFAEAPSLPPLREQARMQQEWLRLRLERNLPALMRKHGAQMWIVACREYAEDPAFFSPYPDGRHLFFWQDERKTLAEIAKFSKKDAEAFPKYEAYLEKLAEVVESLLLVTPPEVPPSPATPRTLCFTEKILE